MRLVVTRPAEDSPALTAKLRALGHDVISCPLMTIRFTSAPVPERDYRAVLVTSANGARAIAAHPARERLVRATAIAVGPASARACGEAGFTRIEQASGDVRGVIDHVTKEFLPHAGSLLYPSGEVTTGSLEEELSALGFNVDRVVLYQAVAAEALDAVVLALLNDPADSGVLLYSPRTAKIWVDLVGKAGLVKQAESLRYYCISLNAARVVSGALPRAAVSVASTPTEEGMLAQLAHPSA